MVALAPTLLTPYLQDIQKELDNLTRQYGSNIRLEVLDKNEEHGLVDNGAASRTSVFNFFSNTSRLLSNYHYLKKNINSERSTRVQIATTMIVFYELTLSLVLIAPLLYAIYFFVNLKKSDNNSNANNSTVDKPSLLVNLAIYGEYALIYLIFTLTIIYFMIAGSVFYNKTKNNYNKYYQTDNIYSDDPEVKQIINMMRFNDTSMTSFLFGQKTLKVSGTCPILGMMLKENEEKDVVYHFNVDTLNDTSSLSSPDSSPPPATCLNKKKTFNFKMDTTQPYKLSMTSLLDKKNMPCPYIRNENELVLSLVNHQNEMTRNLYSALLKKKISKYDYGFLIDSMVESVEYFRKILSKKEEELPQITETMKDAIYDSITNILLKHRLLMVHDICPLPSYLATFDTARIKNEVSAHEFISESLDMDFVLLYYDNEEKKGYIFQKDDMEKAVFYYVDKNNENPRDDRRFALFKWGIEPNKSVHMLLSAVNSHNTYVNYHFRSKNMNNSNNEIDSLALYDANINKETGMVESKIEGTLRYPKYDNLTYGPNYKEMFVASFRYILQQEEIPEMMSIYKIPISAYCGQNLPDKLDETLHILSPLLNQMIMPLLNDSLKNNRFIFENDQINDVIKDLEEFYGDHFRLVEEFFFSFLEDLPHVYREKYEIKDEEEGKDIDHDVYANYCTSDHFTSRIMHMKKSVFIKEFLYHLENMRFSAQSLEKLDSKFSTREYDMIKTKYLWELTFAMFLVIGILSLGLIVFKLVMWYLCKEIKPQIEYELLKKKFNAAKDENEKEFFGNKMERFRVLYIKRIAYLVLFVLVISSIVIISLGFIWLQRERSRNYYLCNHNALRVNNGHLISGSQYVFDFMINLIKNRQIVPIDRIDVIAREGDADKTYIYIDYLSRSNNLDEPLNWNGNIDLTSSHEKLIEVLESYKKANSILDSSLLEEPFPITEFILYLSIIVICLFIIFMIYARLKPIQHYTKIILWRRLKFLMSRNVTISPDSYGFSCDKNAKINEKDRAYNILIFVGAACIFLLALFVTVAFTRSTRSLAATIHKSQEKPCR